MIVVKCFWNVLFDDNRTTIQTTIFVLLYLIPSDFFWKNIHHSQIEGIFTIIMSSAAFFHLFAMITNVLG